MAAAEKKIVLLWVKYCLLSFILHYYINIYIQKKEIAFVIFFFINFACLFFALNSEFRKTMAKVIRFERPYSLLRIYHCYYDWAWKRDSVCILSNSCWKNTYLGVICLLWLWHKTGKVLSLHRFQSNERRSSNWDAVIEIGSADNRPSCLCATHSTEHRSKLSAVCLPTKGVMIPSANCQCMNCTSVAKFHSKPSPICSWIAIEGTQFKPNDDCGKSGLFSIFTE